MTAERTNAPEQPRQMETFDKSQQGGKRLYQEIPKCVHSLGRLDKPYHIEIDPTVKPVVNPVRTVPAALREKVKAELEDMEKQGVIRRVDEPTDWVNSMAIVEKSDGSLRICLDPKHLNQAIKREYYQLPTIEDITTHGQCTVVHQTGCQQRLLADSSG